MQHVTVSESTAVLFVGPVVCDCIRPASSQRVTVSESTAVLFVGPVVCDCIRPAGSV